MARAAIISETQLCGIPKGGPVPSVESGASPEPWRNKGPYSPYLLGQRSVAGNAEPELTNLMQPDAPKEFFSSYFILTY